MNLILVYFFVCRDHTNGKQSLVVKYTCSMNYTRMHWDEGLRKYDHAGNGATPSYCSVLVITRMLHFPWDYTSPCMHVFLSVVGRKGYWMHYNYIPHGTKTSNAFTDYNLTQYQRSDSLNGRTYRLKPNRQEKRHSNMVVCRSGYRERKYRIFHVWDIQYCSHIYEPSVS